MTSTVVVANGVGRQTGTLFAFDRESSVAVSGLASAYNGHACTAWVSSLDGATKLATATATPSSGDATFAFDLDTAAVLALFQYGLAANQSLRLRAVVTATDEVVFDAPVTMVPGARAGVSL